MRQGSLLKATTLAGISLAAAALSGCTTVNTGLATHGAGTGIAYHLPRARFQLSVLESDGAVTATLSSAIVADGDAPMQSSLPHNGGSDDNVIITVDTKTNLLAKVDVTSVGRVTDIATNAARSSAFLQGSESRAATEIFKSEVDPSNFAETVQRANEALRDHFRNNCTGGLRTSDQPFDAQLRAANQPAAEAQTTLRTRLLMCRGLRNAGIDGTRTNFITLSVDGAEAGQPSAGVVTANQPVAAAEMARCARGVCYRPLRPVRFTLGVGRYLSQSETFLMPDRSRLMFVDLTAGIFAQQKYVLTFNEGVLTSYQQDAHSELVGLARLPGEIVGAFIGGATEALGLRQERVAAETTYLDAVRANVEAQNSTAAVCANSPNACPGSAYRIMRVPITPRATPTAPVTGGADGGGNPGGNSNGGVPQGGG